jgi:hypothetical protein
LTAGFFTIRLKVAMESAGVKNTPEP